MSSGNSITFNADVHNTVFQNNTEPTGFLYMIQPIGTPIDGQRLLFRIKSVNVQTFSWATSFVGSTDLVLPTASSAGNKYDYLGFAYNAAAGKWQLIAKNFGF